MSWQAYEAAKRAWIAANPARIARFIKSCFRLRSVRLALWVLDYDNAKTKN